MARTPSWKGSTRLNEAPTSPRYIEDREGERLIQEYEGPIATCRSEKPVRGAAVAGWAGLEVDHISIEPLPGGVGRLVVVSQPPSPMEGTGSGPDGGSPIYEFTCVSVSLPVEKCIAFKDVTADKILKIRGYIDEKKIISESERTALGTDGAALYDMLAAGIETYDYYHPVVRETRYFRTRPNGEAINVRDVPPVTFGVVNGVWLRTGCDINGMARSWQKVREWTAYETLNPILYPP
jgi:hypothetical protein